MATKSRGVGLLDEVLQAVPTKARRMIPWYERLGPEHRAEVESLKAAWMAGRIAAPKWTAAKIIADKLQARGIATIGPQGVKAWLDAKT